MTGSLYKTLQEDKSQEADPLKGVPVILKLASKMKRIALFGWEHPHILEEFLVPATENLDWTIPDWLLANLYEWDDNKPKNVTHPPLDHWWGINDAEKSDQMVLLVRTAFGADGGEGLYNQMLSREQDVYPEVYHDLWSATFQPSPPVQARIDEELHKLNLEPGKYTGFHYRSQYLTDQSKSSNIEKGLNCALHYGAPIFVTTVSEAATAKGLRYATNYSQVASRDLAFR